VDVNVAGAPPPARVLPRTALPSQAQHLGQRCRPAPIATLVCLLGTFGAHAHGICVCLWPGGWGGGRAASGGGADERMKAEAALNERRRRVHLFSQQLRSLRGALVKAYKACVALGAPVPIHATLPAPSARELSAWK
jgi:hypothetical protein